MSITSINNTVHPSPAPTSTKNIPPSLATLPAPIESINYSKTLASGEGDREVSKKRFFQELKEKYPAHPFLEEVEKELQKKAQFTFQVDEEIFNPNQAALQQRVYHYHQKYGILIQLVEPKELRAKINTWLQEVQEPTYLGVITRSTLRTGTLDEGHVTPILLYLPGTSDLTQVEAVIMDTIGEGVPFERILLNMGISETKLYSTIRVRQATQRSCRIGALALLRNALLALKHHQVTDGFSTILNQEAQFSQEKDFTIAARPLAFLPPEWDYTEQASNPLLKTHHLAIHTCFNPKKAPKSAQEHRQKYQKLCTINYKVWSDLPPQHIHSQPPKGIKYKGKDFWVMEFSLDREINTYLFEKGKKQANKRDKSINNKKLLKKIIFLI